MATKNQQKQPAPKKDDGQKEKKPEKGLTLESINWQSLVNNRRYLLLSIGTGLIATLILFSGLIPNIRSVIELNQELQTEKRDLADLQRKYARLESVVTLDSFAAEDEVAKILPSRKPLLELLSTLSEVAGENNIQISRLSLSPGEIASESAEFLNSARAQRGGTSQRASIDGYDTIQVELETNGTFANTQQFFLDIERAAPLITIRSLSIDVDTDDVIRPEDDVSAELLLSTYYFTQPISSRLDSPLPNIGNAEQAVLTEILGYRYPAFSQQQQIIGGGLENLFGEVQDLTQVQSELDSTQN